MMLYRIVLCLVIFGAASAAIEDAGFYPVHLPQTGNTGITEAQVTDLSNAASNTPVNAFSAFTLLTMLGHVLLSAFLAVITVIPFLTAYGVPMEFAVMIQTPIWLVTAFGVYQMYTGHQATGMD